MSMTAVNSHELAGVQGGEDLDVAQDGPGTAGSGHVGRAVSVEIKNGSIDQEANDV